MIDFYSVPDTILKLSYIVGILSCVGLAGACLEYRKQPAVKIYLGLVIMCSFWLFANMMMLSVVKPAAQEMFVRLRFIPLSITPVLWLYFCLELFRKPGERRRSTSYMIFAVVPVMMVIANCIPALHPLMVYDVRQFIAFDIPGVDWRIGPLVQLHIFSAYVILFITIAVCLRGLKSEGSLHRRYSLLMIVAISAYMIPEWIGFFIYHPIRFWGIASLTQIPAMIFIYGILHKQQMVRTFSSTNDKLFESLPVPALLFNGHGQLTLFNTKAIELFSISLSSAGRTIENIVPSGLQGEPPTLESLKKSYVCEIMDLTSKNLRYFEASASMIDVQGLFGQTFILVSFAEVTATKRNTVMNQRLMSVLSHDLLGNLSGLVTLSNHRHPQHWDLIAETSRSSVDLLKNVLLWTSSHGGFYNCHKEPFDLHELAQTVVSQSGSFLNPKSLSVRGSLMQESIVAFVDLKMFSAILRNLLSNAARFSPPQGIIEVNCSLKGDDIELTVDDQGPGMAPEVAKTILAADDKPATAASQGYGIGLFLVQQFVRMHAGTLEVLGNSQGGCSMKITFPAVPPPTH